MNLFSPILKLFGMGGLVSKDKGPQTASSGGNHTDAGISVTDERAMQVSAVWACVQYIVNSVCSLPINFYRRTSTGREELDNHYLVDLFHRSPNALMKPRDFRKAMTTQLAIWSNAYAYIEWSGNRPIYILPLRAGRMTPYIGETGDLTYHYATNDGVKIYAQKSILHMKGLGIDGISALERVNYARECLGLSVSADVYAAKQFKNSGHPGGGYLMLDQWLTDDQRKQARKLYDGLSETAYNKGKLWILEGGIQYKADSLNPDQMQMLETRKMQLSEIARFWGVPEALIGAGTGGASSWPASFEQQTLSFLTFTLQDYIDEWESALRHSLLPPQDRRNIIIDHDVSQFIKMDSVARGQYLGTLTQNGLMTRNEGRATLNMPERPNGDELTAQVNLAPLDKLGQTAQASAPPTTPIQQ